MPTAIIDRQKALTRIGEIRTGGEKPASGRGAGKKLEAFRLTSQHKDIIEKCAELYGGEVTPWESPSGPAFQVYTEANALPVLLVMGHSLNQVYELREGQECVRRCDGITEDYTDGPCICNAEGVDKCEVITRLMVVLPDTGTGLGWQLRSKGENAARELGGAMAIAENLAQGRALLQSVMRLTQRRSIINGQTVKYTVPVLDYNLGAEAQAISVAQSPPELPNGYKPVAGELPMSGATVAEGLEAAATQEYTRRPKGQAPLPQTGENFEFGGAPPVEETSAPAPAADAKKITRLQQTRLFAIAKAAGVEEDELREFVKTYTGQDSTKGITVDAYEPLCAAIKAQGVKS